MLIRVLIINRQLVFAVTIKQALEQTGVFEVHPFTDPSAATEYLRSHPHDAVLVDFSITVMQGPEIVKQLRAIQPDVAIVVSPAQPQALMRELDLQQSIDPPFSARSIIPVIEHAIQQKNQPSSAVTRTFVDSENPEAYDTEILTDESQDEDEAAPGQAGVSEPAQTRIFNDEGQPAEPSGTRLLDEGDAEDDLDDRVTRMFDDDEDQAPAITRIFDNEPPDFVPTRQLDDRAATAPPGLPEFSSLDDVLNDEEPSGLYEPAVKDSDTPAVPEIDSDAVRQYLATGSGGDNIFDQMLGEIVPEDEEQPQLPASSSGFDELVNSMRRDQTHTPLPDRHQQFVEFILKGGMDGLLSEIEKTQTDKLDAPQAAPEDRRERSTFDKLAAEEPPPPTLEESGTVGDLMVGVSDTSFRNVLSMMRGEEIAPPSEAAEAEDDYAAFFDSEVGPQASAPAQDQPAAGRPPEPRFEPWVPEPEEEEDDSSIPAQLILETTLDESTPPEAFSINNLLGSIEQQLTEHKPDIRPLPSWPVDSLQPKSPDRKRQRRRKRGESDLYIREPDFLPEEFPTPAPAREVEPAASLSPFEEPAAVEELEINGAELSMFEELGEAISEAPVEPEKPRIARLADTRPVETILDEELESFDEAAGELPPLEEEAADFNTMETVLGEMAAAQAEQRVSPVDEIDWDAEPSWQEPAWEEADEIADMEQEAEAPAASLPTFEDDWSLTIDEASGELTEAIGRVEDQEQPGALAVGADSQPEAQVFQLADQDDPYIAQIALSLTQVSLELAAEATLLTNDEEIVAIAGELEPDDVEEIRDAIADDWDANPDEARVRFITLASSGKDYMLYSRKTVGDFTLSMIFSGTTPLRDIRRQGKRLVESLEAVPDLVAQHEVPELVKGTDEVSAVPSPPTGETALQPFTYLWLLNNPDFAFGQNTARAITAGLSLQLGELGWQVKSLQTEGEYIYLQADIPGERAPHEIIQDLKRRAAEIAQAQQPDLDRDNLWADSYLVMMPGRELAPDEINQFINFERMF